MKYLVRARIKEGAEDQVRHVIMNGSVPGAPSYFGEHVADCFAQAQRQGDGSVLWIETCYCERYFGEPLAEEKDSILPALPSATCYKTRQEFPIFGSVSDVANYRRMTVCPRRNYAASISSRGEISRDFGG